MIDASRMTDIIAIAHWRATNNRDAVLACPRTSGGRYGSRSTRPAAIFIGRAGDLSEGPGKGPVQRATIWRPKAVWEVWPFGP